MKHLLTAAALLALGTATAAFAGPPEQPRVVDFEGAGKTVGKPGGTLTMLMAKSKDVRWMTVYGGARLVTWDENYELAPDILESIEVDGNKSFTLKLRKGHLWSDGKPFTTEDFRYWWEDVAQNEMLSKGGVPRQMLVNGKLPEVEFIDELTVRYAWDEVNPVFLTALAGARPLYLYMPAHFAKQYHEKYADPVTIASLIESEKVQNWSSLHKRFTRQYRPENPDMPSLQPWTNTTSLPSERIVFKKNPNYHRVDPTGQQLPYIDEVVLNIASSSIIAAKAGTGESDLQARYLRFDNYAFLKQGAEKGGYDVRLWPSGRGSEMTLLPNLNAKDAGFAAAFADANVRRALSLGIDRTEINEAIFFGLGTPQANSVLPDSPLFTPRDANAYVDHDVNRANTLLDEAGFDKKDGDGVRLMPDGRPFEIIVETAGESSQETDILQLIADHWRAIGVRLFVKPSQRDILRGRVSNGETVMSTWQGLNRGLATAQMDPEELAPVSPVQAQWPAYGLHYESKGTSGVAPTGKVAELSELYGNWRDAGTVEEQREIWSKMLSIFTDQVYSIGIVSGGLQPVVISKRLKNVPEKAVWAFEPTLYFAQSMPDTYYFAD